MKLNKRHIAALDIAINTLLDTRDACKNSVKLEMYGVNAQRLRQLRIILVEAFVNPSLPFEKLFTDGLDPKSDLVKGIRALTGHCEDKTE